MMSATGTVATTTTSGSGGCGIDLTLERRLDECLQDGIESRLKSKRKAKRSSDLPVLEGEYDKTKERFNRLIEVAKSYNKHCALLDQSRLEFAVELSNMSKGTPLQAKVISETQTTKCFSNVYNLASLQSKKDCAKFRNDIVGYCLEWERTVIGRLDNEIVKSKELLGVKLHYEDKLPALRKKVYESEKKGSKAPAGVLDKLRRNESKLRTARNQYESHAFELVIQLEEAIVCSWKDLFPLLQYMMTWESERACTEHKIFKNLQASLLRELTDQFEEVKDYKAVRMSKANGSSDTSDSYDDNNDNGYESVNMSPEDDDAESIRSNLSQNTGNELKESKVDDNFLKGIILQKDESSQQQHQHSEPVVIKTLGSGRISKK